MGKPGRPRWREAQFGSVVEELVRKSGYIDVYVITGDRAEPSTRRLYGLEGAIRWAGYLWAVGAVALSTLVAAFILPYSSLTNLVMIYLLGVIFVAARHGMGPSMVASILSVLAFDFFFVPPYFTFAVSDAQNRSPLASCSSSPLPSAR